MTLSELQKRKLTRFFKVYDQNHDGVIERKDYIMLAENVARAKGYPLQSPLAERLKEALMQVWNNLEILADKNHDEVVTLQEFLDYRDKLHDDEMKFNDLVTVGLTLFDIMDENHDGRVNQREFELFYRFFDLERSLADAMFKKLDTEGVGYLTRPQMQEYSRQFNLGDNPDDIGNWLFGPY